MVQLPKPFPRLFRAVPKPEGLGASAIAQAQPIYVDGLAEGGGAIDISDVEGLQSILDDMTARLDTLDPRPA